MHWQSLRRNWYIAISGLLVTIGLVVATYSLIPAKYEANSQLVLLPPLDQGSANYNGVVNPFMGLAGLQSMADIISTAMMDDQTAKALKELGVSQYNVEYDGLSAGPILIVQATGSSPGQASAALSVLDRQVPLTLARLQDEASIAPRSFITSMIAARPSTPAKSYKTELRAIALAFVVGLVTTLLAVSVVDAWRIRRRTQSSSGQNSYVGTSSAFMDANSEFPLHDQEVAKHRRLSAQEDSGDMVLGNSLAMTERTHGRGYDPGGSSR